MIYEPIFDDNDDEDEGAGPQTSSRDEEIGSAPIHDVESLFWVLIYFVMTYDGPGIPRTGMEDLWSNISTAENEPYQKTWWPPFGDFRTESDIKAATLEKSRHLRRFSRFEGHILELVTEYFKPLEDLIIGFRHCLVKAYKSVIRTPTAKARFDLHRDATSKITAEFSKCIQKLSGQSSAYLDLETKAQRLREKELLADIDDSKGSQVETANPEGDETKDQMPTSELSRLALEQKTHENELRSRVRPADPFGPERRTEDQH